jgi:predicted DNA-binding transcriptional regulator YafY
MAFRVYDEFKNAKITLENDKFLIHGNVPKNEWLDNYLLGFGTSLEVIEPKDFREYFGNLIKEISNKYL